ncbi:ChaC-like protein [Coniochaeta sp. 2T2.1]|nr:ChaC-like protein [Coniochaeta sp. 2T2.1]
MTDRRIPGWVTGYVRRFWQASQDHRGTPTAPGRVVTLISHEYWSTLSDDPHPSPPDNKVWGVAYRIDAAHVEEVKEYLDIREINGYTIHYTPFHPASELHPSSTTSPSNSQKGLAGGPIKTLVYIGTPDNDQFVGPQHPQQLAEHIYKSEGPSGLNRDYLWGLERSLEELCPESGDEHVRDLAERVRRIAEREEGKDKEREMEQRDVRREEYERHGVFARRGSVDEVEETEK